MLRCALDDPEHFASFRALNYQWLQPLLGVQASDRAVLDNPAQVLARGGHILSLLLDDEPVGCCALLANQPKRFELAKMAVHPDHRGKGLGHHLLRAAIEQARDRGARHIDLRTSKKLLGAIALYERHGFVRREGCGLGDSRCDVVMVLDLG